MTITKYNDYLQKRLSEDATIPMASVFGISAIGLTSNDFNVLVIGKVELSFYKYKVVNKKFYVTEYRETIPHAITQAISNEMLENEIVQKWWEHIFFNQTYDNFYDDLKIADHSIITFKELIARVSSAIDSLDLPIFSEQVFLTGEISSCPLVRYVLRSKINLPIIDLPQPPAETWHENDFVVLPNERLELHSLNVNESIRFTSLISAPVIVTLPLISKSSEMTTGIKWEEMLHDYHKDYTVGNFDFKIIKVQVECDSFQNIFLLCQDINGNSIVKHITER